MNKKLKIPQTIIKNSILNNNLCKILMKIDRITLGCLINKEIVHIYNLY